jgi:alkylation response protein AidB-like acyl-CoA dehydrogenase
MQEAAVTVESQELAEIRSLARDFAHAELRPGVERWDHERAHDPALRAHLAEIGFYGVVVPERFGGMELDAPSTAAILQELAWGEPSVALALAIHARAAMLILEHGTDEQKTGWLERLATGEAVACLALAEEDAGSDLDAITTTARRTDDGFTINAEKRWVTNGTDANVAIVLAKLDGANALFLVDPASAGVERGKREDTLGLRSLPIITLTLKECRVGADALLGGKAGSAGSAGSAANAGTAGSAGNAAAQLATSATFERLAIAAIALGIAESALEHAIGYANVREQFGQPLRAFEGIQFKLADMATRTAAASALVRAAALSSDAQQTLMAKLFSTETAMEVTTQAVQIYGGYGYMRDYPVEKLMRDAKAMEILGGANELLRVAVAEALYRD